MKALRIAFAIWCLFATGYRLRAGNNAYRETKHGDPVNGVQRIHDRATGSCRQCHETHAHGGVANYDAALFAPNDNDLCFLCHSLPGAATVYPGNAAWSQSEHAKSPSVYGPSPRRTPSDANKCINCHDPHGVRDANGVIPAMLGMRDSDLCTGCHNGSRARTDIARDMSKSYRHASRTVSRHTPAENTPAAFAAVPTTNRHVECSDCHNVHILGADPAPPFPPQASNRLAGVSRVSVANGGAGAAPTYRFLAAEDPNPANEYEICFKCHSSYTTQPPGQSNLALLTNPANPSFHPIQAAGKNPRIDPAAFVNGYTADRIITCSDCHTSDDPMLRGPHGSTYQYLLKKPSTSTTLQTTMPQNDICFDCHSYDVYANPKSSDAVQRASRFSGTRGHGYHVGSRDHACFACHETHGSARYPTLIASRAGGMTGYAQTPTGGTCTPSCHNVRTYTITYPR